MSKKDPYDLRQIFEDLTLGLINNLKRNLSGHKKEEVKEGFKWEMWQKAKLRALQGYRNINKRLIKTVLKEAEEVTGEVIQDSYEEGQKRAEKQINRAQKRAVEGNIAIPEDTKLKLVQPPEIDPVTNKPIEPKYDDLPKAPLEQDFFALNEKKLDALEKAAKDDIKKAGNSVLRKVDDVYRQVIFRAEAYMTAGAKTLDQAIDMATRDFLAKGIDGVTYADGSRMEIGAYAEMALRTASQRATFLGEGKKRDEWGIYTVVMSTHDNCSPWCLPYQGTIMIDDVYTSISKDKAQELSKETGYTLLSDAMKDGAFHPNCRHSLSTFFPGISRMPDKSDDEKASRNYEAEQRQRYIERQIRRYKRLKAGSIDAANVNKYGNKVKEWKEILKEHLEANSHLRRDRDRESLIDPIKSTTERDILSDRKWLEAPFSTDKRLTRHVKDHGNEYGGVTEEEYLNMARDLLAASVDGDVKGFVSKEGTLFKYRSSTNDFAIGRPDGRISTIFKPVDKYEYWLEQIKLYGSDEL